MPMDTNVVNEFDKATARAVGAAADFSVNNSQVMAQLGVNIAAGIAFDTRLMSGFMASQLFNLDAIQAKTAYDTPHPPGTAPVPGLPAKAPGT